MPDATGARVGTVLTLPGAVAAELFSESFDFVWIDLEHGSLGPAEALEMILGAQAAGASAFVRLRCDDFPLMVQVLDAGADGLVLADVPDADAALAAVDRTSHPPRGSRGWGPRRSALRSRNHGGASKPPQLWAQIERWGAVLESDAIAAVDGIEALVVGTADLSLDLGVPQQFDAPQLLDAVAIVRVASSRARVRFGVAGPLTTAPPALVNGAAILCHSTDARIAAVASDAVAAALRQLEGNRR